MGERLLGKRALITAAAQGIGRATALAFAAEGAEVFATDINAQALATLNDERQGNLETFLLDALDADSVRDGVGNVEPEILFNCAGFVHAGTVLEATDEEFQFAFDLNVRSMFWTIRAALPKMLERRSGSIINVASVASSILGVPNRFVYGASKAAVIGLTKSVAKDCVTKGVRCNAICPGTVDSPSLHDRLHATGDYESTRRAFVARQPMGRLGAPEEIAALAVYLASDESAFATGQTFVIDGGMAG
jgi:2-keto-3-deoxy-L-fuconate dehydrogenase